MRQLRAPFDISVALAIACGALAAGCGDAAPGGEQPAAGAADSAASVATPGVVDIVVEGHIDMRLSSARVPAGWTTFRLRNASSAVHFVAVEKLPDGRNIEDYRREVAPVFQNLMDTFNEKPLSFPEAGSTPPEWFGEVRFMGGPGLVSSGRNGQVTVHLEPGTYVLECYVKTEDEVFHSVMGMAAELVVTENRSGVPEPESTMALTLSQEGGIDAPATARPGRQTVAVHFEDQTVYDHFLGHDVHLARLDDGTDLDALGAWMDWTRTGGLAEPAPATFIAGIQDMPAGSTGYIDIELEPGDYAWVAEVPDPAGHGMLRRFSVPVR